MSLMQWDPFEDVGTLRRAMDRLLEEFFTPRRLPGDRVMVWEPPVDMYETETEVVVRSELPRIDPRNLDVTMTRDTITIKGETRSDEEERGRTYHARQLRYGAFARTVELPAEVNGGEAKATYRDGMLEVRIPKSNRLKPVSVRVPIA
jgi:HSP20 family protein